MDQEQLDAIQASVSAGVKAAVSDPATWEAGFAAMKAHLRDAAEAESGRWVIGWLGWLARKAALGLAVVAVMYYAGGLPAVLTWLKVK